MVFFRIMVYFGTFSREIWMRFYGFVYCFIYLFGLVYDILFVCFYRSLCAYIGF